MRAPPLRRHVLLAAAGLPLRLRAQGQPQTPPLVLGVVPNVSPRVLAVQYQPMRSYLEGRLMRPVQVVTAPDFSSFHQRAADGQYDLVVIAPNLGTVLLADDKARPLGIFEPGVPALAVALREHAADALELLRGRQLATANPASMVALRGLVWLREQGLEAPRDFITVRAPNEDSLIGLLRSGDVAMALMSRGELNQIGDARRDSLAVVQQFALLPGFMVLAGSRLAAGDGGPLRQAMLDFFASPASDSFRASTGVQGLRDISRADRAVLTPLVDATRRALASAAAR